MERFGVVVCYGLGRPYGGDGPERRELCEGVHDRLLIFSEAVVVWHGMVVH